MPRKAPDYIALLRLQEELNFKLKNAYECEIAKGEDHLADFLICYVENLVYELNKIGWSLGRYDYSGDVNFRHSEQWWSDGNEPGEGTILHFVGFSVQIDSASPN